jgi:hypothetical protein
MKGRKGSVKGGRLDGKAESDWNDKELHTLR